MSSVRVARRAIDRPRASRRRRLRPEADLRQRERTVERSIAGAASRTNIERSPRGTLTRKGVSAGRAKRGDREPMEERCLDGFAVQRTFRGTLGLSDGH